MCVLQNSKLTSDQTIDSKGFSADEYNKCKLEELFELRRSKKTLKALPKHMMKTGEDTDKIKDIIK